MGINYDARIAVGYMYSAQELSKCFSSDLEGMFMFDGEDVSSLEELVEEISSYVGCAYWISRNPYEIVSCVFGPHLDPSFDGTDCGELTVGGSQKLYHLEHLSRTGEFATISGKLQRMLLPSKEVTVSVAWTIS